MTGEDAKEFALKFIRNQRPDALLCMQSWAALWKLEIINFRSNKAEYGYHWNYLIAFAVVVPLEQASFLRDDLRSVVFTRLDATEVVTRDYPHGCGHIYVRLDAKIPSADNYSL